MLMKKAAVGNLLCARCIIRVENTPFGSVTITPISYIFVFLIVRSRSVEVEEERRKVGKKIM